MQNSTKTLLSLAFTASAMGLAGCDHPPLLTVSDFQKTAVKTLESNGYQSPEFVGWERGKLIGAQGVVWKGPSAYRHTLKYNVNGTTKDKQEVTLICDQDNIPHPRPKCTILSAMKIPS